MDLTRLGLRWHDSGQASLTGPLLELADQCEVAFRRLGGCWQAVEERHPATLPVRDSTSYLRAFPHQASFAVRPNPDGDDQALGRTAPVSGLLTPAACYHLYAGHAAETLTAPLYLGTQNTCFRVEPSYRPLRRQWSFTMREVVCLGTPAEVAGFVSTARAALDRFAELVDLPLDWLPATDRFFRPRESPGYLSQRLNATKHEATYAGSLAVGSVNQHGDHFGIGFGITRAGAPASSACLAFGIERWLFALVDRHGPDPSCWPDLPAAASAVRGEVPA
jgi:hypothetical protein